jgi:hypothetical protein
VTCDKCSEVSRLVSTPFGNFQGSFGKFPAGQMSKFRNSKFSKFLAVTCVTKQGIRPLPPILWTLVLHCRSVQPLPGSADCYQGRSSAGSLSFHAKAMLKLFAPGAENTSVERPCTKNS